MNKVTFNNISKFALKDQVWEVFGNGVCEVLGQVKICPRFEKFAFYSTNPTHSWASIPLQRSQPL